MRSITTRGRLFFRGLGRTVAERNGPVHVGGVAIRRRPRWATATALLVGVMVSLWSQPPSADDRAPPARVPPPPELIDDARRKPIWQSVTGHSIRYLVSLPKDWSADRKWPVIVVITGSNSNFPVIAQGYHQLRGDRPFILITPATVSSGSVINAELYPHLPADELARLASAEVPVKLEYDMAGLERILEEVRERFGGEQRVYLSGFSMGGTLAWQMALLRSDRLHMAFPVCAMYREAAVEMIPAGHRPANPALPIRAFQGEKDPWLEGFHKHWERASTLARQVGFQDVTRTVSGRGHSWYHGEILQLCAEHHAEPRADAAVPPVLPAEEHRTEPPVPASRDNAADRGIFPSPSPSGRGPG